MLDAKIHPSHDVLIQKHNGVSWVDVKNPSHEALAELENSYKLDTLHLHESTQKVQHTQVEHGEGYLFLVLHVPVFDKAADKIMVNQVGVFLGKNFLLTIRTGNSPVISNFFNDCDEHPEVGEKLFKQGSSFLLYQLIGNVLNDISTMAETVASELDEIEDQVFDNNASDAQRIGKVRQKIVRLRRVIGPKRIILRDLTEQIKSFGGKNSAHYYSINTKTADKLWEVIEEAKETVEIYKDADFTTSTEQTNEILAVLTLLFTFTIPITIFGTLYGMNVPLPGGIEAGAWTFFGPYTTFEVVLAGSIGSAIAMYLYFKGKHWF